MNAECLTCDTHGPQPTAEGEALLALHRAFCPSWRAATEWMTRMLEAVAPYLQAVDSHHESDGSATRDGENQQGQTGAPTGHR